MFGSDNIEGIEALRAQLPEELQHWHKFGSISGLEYKTVFDSGYCGDIGCLELLLTDIRNKYTVKMLLYNVSGDLSFNIPNGFYSGLTIDDCSGWGYEKNCRFRISSSEQDIDLALYCERIKVELL